MRKVFFSNMFGQKLNPDNEYVSDDFDLKGKQYLFPLTYVLANNVDNGDEVLVVTSVEKGNEVSHGARDNYELYKAEVKTVVDAVNATVMFEEIWTDDEYDVTTGKKFFTQAASFIHDNDKIYADITFGIKIFSVTSFIALTYVVRANKNVSMEHLIYSWKYSSAICPEKAKFSKIYDVTSLFYLNEIAGQLNEGDRQAMDKMLDF